MLKMKWIYLPPLLIYASAGVSGLTNIVGIFFLKDYLNLSAAFIASIGFWAGIPWALKMPVGFLVDKYWKYKNILVFIGATIIFISLLIMYLLLKSRSLMELYLQAENWFILSAILTPIGYVVQDVVADAMTVEVVENRNDKNFDQNQNSEILLKKEHTLVQMYGRFAIISGSLLVSLINVLMFKGIDMKDENLVYSTYTNIYLLSLMIPFLSVFGVILYSFLGKNSKKFLLNRKLNKLDYKIFIGSIIFVFLAVFLGGMQFPFAQEMILITSLSLIGVLMFLLTGTLEKKQRFSIVGTAIIIFVYRSMPSPGPGLSWFEIDILNFDQAFLSSLSVIAALLTLIGMIVFKNTMVRSSVARLFLFLSFISAILYTPSILMYYGFHNYTIQITNGIIDARFIALINTAIESPVSQIAMIPMLAWIAKNAPIRYKATFFAVFASFTNLALSTRELITKYLNSFFVVKREVRDIKTKEIMESADYSNLGELLITVTLITLVVPILTVIIIQKTKYRSRD